MTSVRSAGRPNATETGKKIIMFSVEQSWKMSEPEKVLAIIKEVGTWRLANFDGCVCSSFSIRNVEVDISCGKGRDRAVRVYSCSFDYEENHDELLRPIAEELKRQIEESCHRGLIPISFKPWKQGEKIHGSMAANRDST
jgi:hypothetical protein